MPGKGRLNLDTRLYTRTVVDHFWNPRNLRAMPDASAEGRAINRACSDVVRLFIRVEDGVVDPPDEPRRRWHHVPERLRVLQGPDVGGVVAAYPTMHE